jgi:hypothetical protein
MSTVLQLLGLGVVSVGVVLAAGVAGVVVVAGAALVGVGVWFERDET